MYCAYLLITHSRLDSRSLGSPCPCHRTRLFPPLPNFLATPAVPPSSRPPPPPWPFLRNGWATRACDSLYSIARGYIKGRIDAVAVFSSPRTARSDILSRTRKSAFRGGARRRAMALPMGRLTFSIPETWRGLIPVLAARAVWSLRAPSTFSDVISCWH